MSKREELKKELLQIRKNDWSIPGEKDVYEFTLELVENIGDLEGELRDYLILEMLGKIIEEDLITREQIKEVLNNLMSDDHLFLGVGEKKGDDVFNRSFSALVIRVILTYHRKSGYDLLSSEEVHEVYENIIKYMRLEQETRGYVKEGDRGWAHAIAHGADTLSALSNCVELSKNELKEILEVIKEKICIDELYTHSEDERLTTSVIYVMKREVISKEEILKWIQSFEDVKGPTDYPEKMYFNQNIKKFLRSLYFRLKYINAPNIYIDEIEKVQNSINELFNNIIDRDAY